MMSRIQLKQAAKSQIKGNIGMLFICALLIFLIVSASGITFIGPILIAPAFMISMSRIYLNLTKGTKPQVENIFSGFDVFGKSIWLYILIYIFTYLWMLLLIVPGIIKSLSYSMSFYILAENPTMKAREALNQSKKITQGHKGELFFLYLSFIPWILLGCITFGLAFIYAGPYIAATVTNFYLELKKAAVQK